MAAMAPPPTLHRMSSDELFSQLDASGEGTSFLAIIDQRFSSTRA
jgi:hypothetical protein